MKRALLFDLDETLIVDEASAVGAFQATAALAGERASVDVERLALDARAQARELWHAGPSYAYCQAIGISSWEALWCWFEGDYHSEIGALRKWTPGYRRGTWRRALALQGVIDEVLVEELSSRFGVERRARHETFEDSEAALRELSEEHTLALITNGASCLQREKLAASGLGKYFDAVIVSGEFGIGKPDASIFRHALDQLETGGPRAVIVGDNLDRDIAGADAAGLHAVWINRLGRERPSNRPELMEVTSLAELSALLEELD